MVFGLRWKYLSLVFLYLSTSLSTPERVCGPAEPDLQVASSEPVSALQGPGPIHAMHHPEVNGFVLAGVNGHYYSFITTGAG